MDFGAYTPLVTLVVVGLIAGWISGMLFGQRGLIRYLVVGILGAWARSGHAPSPVLGMTFSRACGADSSDPGQGTGPARAPRSGLILRGVELEGDSIP